MFARFVCVFCLEPRDLEIPTPVNVPIVVQNMLMVQGQQPSIPLRPALPN